MFRRRLASAWLDGGFRQRRQASPGYDPIPSLLATAPSCLGGPGAVPSASRGCGSGPRGWRGEGRESADRHQRRPRGRSEQVTAGRGPAPGRGRTCLTLAGNLLQG